MYPSTSTNTSDPRTSSFVQLTERLPADIAGLLKNWEETIEGGFSANQIIDAYLIGREHGKTEEQRILTKIFEKNIGKAFSFSEDKFREVKRIFGVEPMAMRMRIVNISSFETLLIFSSPDYASDKIEAIYAYLMEEMSKVNTEEFTWSFVLMPSAEELNEDAISADGYSLQYAHKAA